VHRSATDVIALIALFVALGTGSAWAVNEWTGANFVDESLTGADVKGKFSDGTNPAANGSLTSADIAGQQAVAAVGQPYVNGTLTTWDVADKTLQGRDVAESTLAKVPDADKLDGIDSGELFRGHGRVWQVKRTIATGGSEYAFQISGFALAVFTCTSDPAANDTLQYRTLTTAETLDVFHDNGLADPLRAELSPGTTFAQEMHRDGEMISFEVLSASGRSVSGTIVSQHQGSSCLLSSQGAYGE
jgi:hypothetical protein